MIQNLLSLLLTPSLCFAHLPDRASFPISGPKYTVENGVPFVAEYKDDVEELTRFEIPEKNQAAEDSKFNQVMDEDTPVTLEEIAGEKDLTAARPWQAPDFSKQEHTLGYGPKAFAVPEGLEIQVKFSITYPEC